MFNKEKRQQKRERREAVKAELKEQIKPRLTFEQKQAKEAKTEQRKAESDAREGVVAEHLRGLHAGTNTDQVTQIGSELLYLSALSGMQLQINDQMSKKDRCTTRWTVHGRHDNEFLGMAPTNRDVRFGGVSISYLDGERITQEAHYWDMVSLLQQIQAP